MQDYNLKPCPFCGEKPKLYEIPPHTHQITTGGKAKMKKYELTGETKEIGGVTLHRIRALIDIPEHDVKAGDLGGWIEAERNLSQNGEAWVTGSACVTGKAWVTDSAWVTGEALVTGSARVIGNAWVSGNARIMKSSDCITIGAIGSRNDTSTFYRGADEKIYVSCGCFNGSIDDFASKVKAVHAGTKHEKTYLLAIELAKAQIET